MRTAAERPRTKEKLLKAAQGLMQAKGFGATTVDEICGAAGVTKGSFFHYFAGKEALGRELLERFCRQNAERQESACCRERDPLERLYSIIDCAIAMAKDPTLRNGCLLGTFAQELSDSHPKMRSLCAHEFQRWADYLKKDLDEAKAQYAPKSRIRTQDVADYFIALLEGSLIVAKAKQDPGVVERTLKQFKIYLGQLFGR